MSKKTIFDERTLYTVTDEHGERTTITLDKFVADVLQECLNDVHSWIQEAYNKVVEKLPDVSRREKGDVVRLLAGREAEKCPKFKMLLSDLLGL
jgi:hypothetical protein